MTKSTIFVYPIEGRVERRFKSGIVHKSIGTPTKDGHLFTFIDGRGVMIHRLIYAHFHGPIPAHLVIDHINGNPQDNRIENLRLVTQSQNQQNRREAMSSSKTGVKGVSFEANRYRVVICVDGQRHNIGRFKTLNEAKKAYANAAATLHTHNPAAI
jgi:hypothetical protein